MIRRRLAAAFVTWHLLAIALGALPPAERFNNFPKRTRDEAPSALVWTGTRILDGLAAGVRPFVKGVWWITRPVRPAVNWYLKLTGLGQSWAMFSNPPRVDQYARVRYYVRPPQGPEWTATELVMPANPEDEVRLFQSYRDSYRDKAIAIALDSFYRRRSRAAIAPGTQPNQLPNDLAPIGRYFARRFERRYLGDSGERIVRVEVWIGNARTSALGQPVDHAARAERTAALQGYWEAPVEQRLRVPPYPPYHGHEREADVDWVLEYFELP
jgi:hypothetical protein